MFWKLLFSVCLSALFALGSAQAHQATQHTNPKASDTTQSQPKSNKVRLKAPDPDGSRTARSQENTPRSRHSQVAREYFTDLRLITQEGQEVRFYTDVLEGRVVLINGFFTDCHGVCPTQNLVLSGLQDQLGERLGKEVFIVSITIDPENDTPTRVKEYSQGFDARPGWLFLTGKPENVNWINYKLGQYIENPEDHKGVYLLGNLKTGLWKKIRANAQTEVLFKHLQGLLEDRGQTGNE